MEVPASPSHLPPQHATFNTAWTLDSPSRIFAHPLPKQRAWERQPRPTRGRTVWKRYETRGTAEADRMEGSQDEAQTPEGKVVKRMRVQRDGPATALGRSGSARAAVVERRGSLLPHKLPNSGGLDVGGVMPSDAEGETEQIIVASASASEWRPRHRENAIASGYRASATRAVADRQSRSKSKRRRQTDLPSTNCLGSATKRRRASAGLTSLLREEPALSAIGPSVQSEIALEDSQERGVEILEEEARLEHVEVLEEEAANEEQVSPLLVSEDAIVENEERRAVTEALKKPSESSGRRKTTFPALPAPQSEITKRRASVALDNLEGVSTVAEATQDQVAVDDPSIEPTTAVEQENEGSASKSEKAKVGFNAKERNVSRRQTSANLAELERVTTRDTRRVSAALETLRQQDRPVVTTDATFPPPIEKPTGDIKARSNFKAQERTISRRQTSVTSATVKAQMYTSEGGRRASVALETIRENEQPHASVMDLSSEIEEKQEVTEPSDTQFDREGGLAAEFQVQVDGIVDEQNTPKVVEDVSLDIFQAVDALEASAEVSNETDQVSEDTAADFANRDVQAAEAQPVTADKPRCKPKKSYRRRTVEDNVNAQAPRRTRRATAALEALQRGAEGSGAISTQEEHTLVTSPVIEVFQNHDMDHAQVDAVATHVDDESVSEEQAEAGFAVEMSVTINNVEDAIPTTFLHNSAGDDKDMTHSATADEAQEVAANMFDGTQDHQDSPEIVIGETVIEMQDFTSDNIEDIQDDVTSHVLLKRIPSPTAETEELDTEMSASLEDVNSGLHEAVSTADEVENSSVDVEEGTDSIAILDMEQTQYLLSEETITDMTMFTTTGDLVENTAPNDEISTPLTMEDLTEMMDLAPEPETTETVTTIKVQLNDDDTDMLKDFMSRARASKAAKIAKRSSLLSRQDSNIVKAALSSPRKALENLDSNSPLPREQEVLSPPAGADSVESRPRVRDSESATNDELGDEDELAMAGAEPEAEGNSRRSSRILKSHSRSFSATPSSIAIRRPAGEADAVAFKKSEAQQTALITRTNTRRNKGGSVSARVMLMRMKGIPIDEAAGELEDSPGGVPGLSRVKWNEELVAYFEEKEKDQVPGLGAENKTEALEGAKTETAMSKPRAKRSKMLGAANGTPAKPKYKDLEMSIVTPSTAPAPSSALTKSTQNFKAPSTAIDTPTVSSVPAPQLSSSEIPEEQSAGAAPPLPTHKEASITSTAKPARRIPTPARTKKSISTVPAVEAPKDVPAPVHVPASAKTTALKAPTRVTRRFANAGKDKENEEVSVALGETREEKTGAGKGLGRSVLPRRGVGVRR